MQSRHAIAFCILLALGLGAGFAAACSAAPTPIRIDSVSPSLLATPQAALLLVAGDGFRQGDSVGLTKAGTVGFSSQALGGSLWVNNRLLSAHLPGGLPVGSYDVVVTDPDGRQATRQNAVQIGAPQPARPSPTAAVTATVTEVPRAKATLPPHTATIRPKPSPKPTEAPSAAPTPTPLPAQTPTPQPTPLIPPTRPPTASPTGSAGGQLDISGHWQLIDTIQPGGQQVRFADLVLQQQGNQITGGGNGIASLAGFLQGDTLQANYVDSSGRSGTFIWMFSPDGTSFSGGFTATGINSGMSQGVRISGAAIPAPSRFVVLTSSHGHGQPSHRNAGHGGG